MPPDYPLRQRLNDEVHARPPEKLTSPCRVSFLALVADGEQRRAAWEIIRSEAARCGAPPPNPASAHYSADFGSFRLKAERHTEFYRIKIIVSGYGRGGLSDGFIETALDSARTTWVETLPGQILCAIHAVIGPSDAWPPNFDRLGPTTDGPIGAMLVGGAGAAFTDLRIRQDRFSRLVIYDHGLSPGQIGRTLQRLVEMDTYRMLALMALPIARARTGELTEIERELSLVTAALVSAAEAEEPGLLERLTRLAAQVESLQAESQFRFAAAASYYDLVERRIAELREQRIEGLQTFGEFMERRLAPAMRTCHAVVDRQETLSARISRATDLLSTRVELSSQRQSHALLESMNRRAQLQLRLQETVEGLSVAAITYYIVSLVGKAAEGLEHEGLSVDPTLAMAIAIPVVAGLVALGVWRIRRSVAKTFEGGHGKEP
jgi:uncharacterized membrane-anchored protein